MIVEADRLRPSRCDRYRTTTARLNVNLGSLQYQATSSYINERKVYDQPNGGGLTSAYDYSYDQYGTLISETDYNYSSGNPTSKIRGMVAVTSGQSGSPYYSLYTNPSFINAFEYNDSIRLWLPPVVQVKRRWQNQAE